MQYVMCAYTQNNRERQMKYKERKEEESLSIRIACDMKHLPKFFFSSLFFIILHFFRKHMRDSLNDAKIFFFITLLYAIRRNFC